MPHRKGRRYLSPQARDVDPVHGPRHFHSTPSRPLRQPVGARHFRGPAPRGRDTLAGRSHPNSLPLAPHPGIHHLQQHPIATPHTRPRPDLAPPPGPPLQPVAPLKPCFFCRAPGHALGACQAYREWRIQDPTRARLCPACRSPGRCPPDCFRRLSYARSNHAYLELDREGRSYFVHADVALPKWYRDGMLIGRLTPSATVAHVAAFNSSPQPQTSQMPSTPQVIPPPPTTTTNSATNHPSPPPPPSADQHHTATRLHRPPSDTPLPGSHPAASLPRLLRPPRSCVPSRAQPAPSRGRSNALTHARLSDSRRRPLCRNHRHRFPPPPAKDPFWVCSVTYPDLGLHVPEQLADGLIFVVICADRDVHLTAVCSLARGQAVRPDAVFQASLHLRPLRRRLRRRQRHPPPAVATAPPAPLYDKVPGGFVPRLPSPNCRLLPQELDQLRGLLQAFRDRFNDGTEPLPATTLLKAHLDTGDTPPIFSPPRCLSPAMREVVRNAVADLDAQGITEPGTGSWSTPIVMQPLPRTDDILGSFKGKRYFSVMDMCSGFYQIEVAEEDRPKTSFVTPDCQRQYRRLPFGFASSPAIFQRMVDMLFGGMKWASAVSYVDDIIVFSDTWDDNFRRLTDLFHALRRANLQGHPGKCAFGAAEVKYLGQVVSRAGLRACPSKVKAIADMPVPTTAKAVQRFLGKCQYYRKFIPNFSATAAPLFRAATPKTGFEWSDDCQTAWDALRRELMSEPLLAHPDCAREFFVDCDGSGEGRGAVLAQLYDNGERVVAYASRNLLEHERKWTATELEAAAVIEALDTLRPYIDWAQQKHVDCLSRAPVPSTPDQQPLVLDEFPTRTVLHLRSHSPRRTTRSSPLLWCAHLCDMVQTRAHKCHVEARLLCSRVLAAQHELPSAESSQASGVEVVISQDDAEVSGAADDTAPTTGALRPSWQRWALGGRSIALPQAAPHADIRAAQETDPDCKRFGPLVHLPRAQWPPRLASSSLQFVIESECPFCIATAECRSDWKWLNLPIGCPFEIVATDLFGPLTQTRAGNTHILVFIDHQIRGTPRAFLSDNGPEFTADLLRQLCAQFGVNKVYAAPYHPRGNSIVEAYMRSLKSTLRLCLHHFRRDWVVVLPAAALAYRAAPHSVTKYSPFFLVIGQEVVLPLSRSWNEPALSLSGERWLHALWRCRLPVLRAHQRIEAANRRALRSDAHRTAEGMHVALRLSPNERAAAGKFASAFRGPFIVTRRSRLSPRRLTADLWDPTAGEELTANRCRLEFLDSPPFSSHSPLTLPHVRFV
ncbi:hypothetical protein Emag_007664 [Eimeria magna]